MRGRPSIVYGFVSALRLWRLVAAVWLVSVLVFVPVHLVIWGSAGDVLASLPEGGLPDGETALIVLELLRPIWTSLAAAMVSGWFALWAWTVLWHAGVVRWLLFAGRDEVRLAEILGHGVLGWWRWARLAVTAATALVVIDAALWLVLGAAAERALDGGREGLWLALTALVALLGVTVTAMVWVATIRSSWLLGVGDRRSVVLTWLAGLKSSVRQPLQSVVLLLAWALPGIAAMALPVLAGWQVEALRDGVVGALMEVVTGLVGAFCWVALFLSFAPATGLVGEKETTRA